MTAFPGDQLSQTAIWAWRDLQAGHSGGRQLQIRDCMVLSLVFDHRLVDGAPAARFLQYLKHLLQEPDILLALLR